MFPRKTRNAPVILPTQQRGNSLLGFMVGLLLVVLIIIAILMMLNGNRMRDFKQDPALNKPITQQAPAQNNMASATEMPLPVEEVEPSQTTTIEGQTDKDAQASVSSTEAAEKPAEVATAPNRVTPPVVAGSGSSGAAVNRLNNGNTGNKNNGHVGSGSHNDKTTTARVSPARKPSTSGNNGVRDTSAFAGNNSRPAHKLPRLVDNSGRLIEHPSTAARVPKKNKPVQPKQPPVAVAKAKTHKNTTTAKSSSGVKPSPELILESGSIEKARAEAARRAGDKRLANKTVVAPKANKSHTASGGNVVLQTGSFINARAADAQRARLAMMGISTKIVEAQVNGKSVYRVQTQRLNGNKASETKNALQKNGVSVYQRTE